MPRNPNKKQCAHPNCRNYAMRGRELCRPHLDPILGPRGAGAPKGNLNAIKTGSAAHFNPDKLKDLAQCIIDDSHHYHRRLLQYLEQVARPPADPVKSLVVLRSLIETLIPIVAENLFTGETDELILSYPVHIRPSIQVLIWRAFLPLPPLKRLLKFRKMRDQLLAKRRLRKMAVAYKTIKGSQ